MMLSADVREKWFLGLIKYSRRDKRVAACSSSFTSGLGVSSKRLWQERTAYSPGDVV